MAYSVSVEGGLVIPRERGCRVRARSSAGTGTTLPQPVADHLQTDDSALGDSGREEEQVAPCSR